jgi:hypothetical protein
MLHLLLVYAHVLATVFLVGFALFGTILTVAGADGGLIARSYRAPWPPKGLGVPFGLPVCALGWVAFLVTAGTGAVLLAGRDSMAAGFPIKLALLGLAFLTLVALSVRPRGAVLVLHFVFVLGVVAVSAMLGR